MGLRTGPSTCHKDPVPGNVWSILWGLRFTALGLRMGVIPCCRVQGSSPGQRSPGPRTLCPSLHGQRRTSPAAPGLDQNTGESAQFGQQVLLAQQMLCQGPPNPLHPRPQGPQRCWAGSSKAACAVSEVTAQSGVRRMSPRPLQDTTLPNSPVHPEPLRPLRQAWGCRGGCHHCSLARDKELFGKHYEKRRYSLFGATISPERDLSGLAQLSRTPNAARRGTTVYFTLVQQAVPEEARRPCAPLPLCRVPPAPPGTPRAPGASLPAPAPLTAAPAPLGRAR